MVTEWKFHKNGQISLLTVAHTKSTFMTGPSLATYFPYISYINGINIAWQEFHGNHVPSTAAPWTCIDTEVTRPVQCYLDNHRAITGIPYHDKSLSLIYTLKQRASGASPAYTVSQVRDFLPITWHGPASYSISICRPFRFEPGRVHGRFERFLSWKGPNSH